MMMLIGWKGWMPLVGPNQDLSLTTAYDSDTRMLPQCETWISLSSFVTWSFAGNAGEVRGRLVGLLYLSRETPSLPLQATCTARLTPCMALPQSLLAPPSPRYKQPKTRVFSLGALTGLPGIQHLSPIQLSQTGPL